MTILNEKEQEVYRTDFMICNNDTFDGLAEFFIKNEIDCKKYYHLSDAINDALSETEKLGDLIKRIPDITRCTNDSHFLYIINDDKWYVFNEFNSYSEDDFAKACENVLQAYFPKYKIITD